MSNQSLEGIVDILEVQTGEFQFTVNTAVDSVPIGAVAAPKQFFSAGSVATFQEGDNAFIESIYVRFPYQFGLAGGQLDVFLQSLDAALTPASLDRFGTGGKLFVPFLCNEIVLNNYIPQPTHTAGGNWSLACRDISGNVSMINAPSSLDGQTLDVFVGLKVRHTLDLIL